MKAGSEKKEEKCMVHTGKIFLNSPGGLVLIRYRARPAILTRMYKMFPNTSLTHLNQDGNTTYGS